MPLPQMHSAPPPQRFQQRLRHSLPPSLASVLDEADEMLRMGFIDALTRILEAEARGSRSFAIEATTVVSADGPIW